MITNRTIIRGDRNGIVRSFTPHRPKFLDEDYAYHRPKFLDEDYAYRKPFIFPKAGIHDEQSENGGIKTRAHEVRPPSFTELEKVTVSEPLVNVPELPKPTFKKALQRRPEPTFKKVLKKRPSLINLPKHDKKLIMKQTKAETKEEIKEIERQKVSSAPSRADIKTDKLKSLPIKKIALFGAIGIVLFFLYKRFVK